MKKFFLAAGVIIAFGFYIVFARKSQHSDSSSIAVVSSSTPVTTTPDQPVDTSPQTTPTPEPAGLYKDGTYTGIVADAFFGPMQVRAIIQGGRIADIQFLQYPNDPGHTTEVSNMSLPRLKSEAIQIQSAQVDIISGATQTTEGFQQSLASALIQAKA